MLEEVNSGYKSLSSMELFESKMLKAEHQGLIAVADTLHGWVGLMESLRREFVSCISVPLWISLWFLGSTLQKIFFLAMEGGD